MEGDEPQTVPIPVLWRISIHSLRMEGDIRFDEILNPKWAFQSTPSAWRETRIFLRLSIMPALFQSTPSAWRETVGKLADLVCERFQSTPSAWRETFSHSISGATPVFQSTPSAWRETVCHSRSPPDWNYFNPLPPHGGRPEREISISVFVSISIHSLRMEGDVGQSTPIQGLRDFNPLPPHGGRPVS